VSITVAPPELVAYSQPMCPQSGYFVDARLLGLWRRRLFLGAWHMGRAARCRPVMDARLLGLGAAMPLPGMKAIGGSTIGFYGGVNYGFGYGGVGYQGGYWQNGAFSYNTSVNNVDRSSFHNTYEKTVTNERAGNSVSYNGGTGWNNRSADRCGRNCGARSVILRQRPHKTGINRPPARTMNYWRRESWQAANRCNLQTWEFTGKDVVAAKGAAGETKATESKAAENKAGETKATESKAAENKAARLRLPKTRQPRTKQLRLKPARAKRLKTRQLRLGHREQSS